MIIYQLLSILLPTMLLFFPVQIDMRINFAIILFAVSLLPMAIENIYQDLRKKNPVTIFFILFLVSSLISTIFSIDQNRSIVQFFLYLSCFIIFVSIRSVFSTFKSKLLFVNCYLFITTALSLISLYHTLILHYVNRAREGVSFMWIYFGHNHLSALLIFAIPISLYLLKEYWHRKIINVLLLVHCYLLIITLFLTFSRASAISLVIACTFITFFLRLLPKQKNFILLPICFVLILVFSFITINAKQIGIRKPDFLNPARVVYWKTAIKNGVSHPLFGTGLDTFRHLSYKPPLHALKTDFAHNFFLQILSDTGVFGFLASIGLIGSLLWQSMKKLKAQNKKLKVEERYLFLALFVGLLASTLNTMVDFDWQISTVFLIFWIFAGLL